MSYALKDEEGEREGKAGSGSLQHEGSVPSLGGRTNSGEISSLFMAKALDTGLGSENEKVNIRDLCAAAIGNDREVMEEIDVILAQAERIFGVDDLSCLCSVAGETFVGKIVAGTPEQLGILEFPSSDHLGRSMYRGQFDEGRRGGLGVLRWSDGTIYEGEFRLVRRQEFRPLLQPHSLTRPFILRLSHSFFNSFTRPSTHSTTHPPTHPLTHSHKLARNENRRRPDDAL